MRPYSEEVEANMRLFFSKLNEREKRRYAAVEVLKLGHGGQKYLAQVFGVSDFLIRKGVKELSNPEILEEMSIDRIRRKGGGRKKRVDRT